MHAFFISFQLQQSTGAHAAARRFANNRGVRNCWQLVRSWLCKRGFACPVACWQLSQRDFEEIFDVLFCRCPVNNKQVDWSLNKYADELVKYMNHKHQLRMNLQEICQSLYHVVLMIQVQEHRS